MSKRWILASQIAASLSLLFILVPALVSDILDFQHDYRFVIQLLLPSPFWAPYIVILWNLRAAGRSDAQRVKKGLALAMSWGGFILLLSAFLLFEGWTACEPDWRGTTLSAVIALIQAILIFSAIRAYYSLVRHADDRQILVTRALIGIAGIVLSALFIPTFVLPHHAMFESASVGSLRTIVVAQQVYSEEHKTEGFASSLSRLGPASNSPESVGLIDGVLASGKKSGYFLILRTGPPQADGRITKYTLSARPERYGNCGTHSFFTDETGVVHYTSENRAATTQDAALE
jgi:hypothetical protein